MSSVNEKMTAIANEVRTLSGVTGGIGLDDMASTLHTENVNFNTNLTTQDNLISQIQAALEGKAVGSEPVLQTKTVTPTTSSQTVTPDSGYDGLSQVTVNAMPTTTQATPSVSIDSAGKITASVTQTAGYVAAGTKSATKQLTTQAAKTVTPSTSSQTAVASGVYTTGAVTVAAIPSTYVKPTATKAATTYTPTTSNQTIAAGTYCSGAQTIKGDANLKAENIKSGVSIFGVTGTAGNGGSNGGDVQTCMMSVESNDAFETLTFQYIYCYNSEFYIGKGSPYETEVICNQWVDIYLNDNLFNNEYYSEYNIEVSSVDDSSYYDQQFGRLFIGTSDTTISYLIVDDEEVPDIDW